MRYNTWNDESLFTQHHPSSEETGLQRGIFTQHVLHTIVLKRGTKNDSYSSEVSSNDKPALLVVKSKVYYIFPQYLGFLLRSRRGKNGYKIVSSISAALLLWLPKRCPKSRSTMVKLFTYMSTSFG